MFLLWRLITLPIRLLVRGGRPLIACIVGYSTIAAVVTGSHRLFGVEQLLQSETWDVSALWIVSTIVAGIVGAFAGGALCHLIDKSGRGTKFLIVLMVLVAAATLLQAGETSGVETRTQIPDQATFRINAVEPTWLTVLKLILNVVSILVVTKLLRRRGAAMNVDLPAAA